ncbi:hypothetical protein PCASD_07158 [Puccinia coronata f. sp. avenae]|uniref:Uncharacterized protein n=1 Tax=Puccinia coronata f. sp. avenae TaxID=200324 RepID=A0A2N5UUL2_9BASI|nr:hypothetical protein PCASD_07158 [Puccinia coronata f. sp. avenae]
MYGVLETPSYVQCSGISGMRDNDFKIQLSTNTALNNKLEDGTTYLMNGRMIALGDSTPPNVTYIDMSVVQVLDFLSSAPDLINKTHMVGLGHVIHHAEVISQEPKRSLRLEVTVAHNNWDPVNLIKTHTLFQVGCEVQAVELLVDFDPETKVPIVLVSSKHQLIVVSFWCQIFEQIPGTAGINRSNTAVRAVLEQPCSTGGRTGTVRPKQEPTGRTDLSDQSRLVLCDRSQELIGQACPPPPAGASVGQWLSDHQSNTAVRAPLELPCSTG